MSAAGTRHRRDARVHDTAGLQALLDVLVADGEVLGPHVSDGTIVARPITKIDQLPQGWTDDQAPGRYRLRHTSGPERFGYAVGPQSWKPVLHQPRVQTLTMTRHNADDTEAGGTEDEVQVTVRRRAARRRTLFGVRPCELAAIGKQDTVLLNGPVADRSYLEARSDVLIVAVNCTRPAATCFCSSMGTGPAVPDDVTAHDIEITELVDTADTASIGTRYVIEAISERGREVTGRMGERAAGVAVTDADERQMNEAFEAADTVMTRSLDGDGLHEALLASHRSTHWDEIADRCLVCGNCTAVCPTCFCTRSEDVTDLSGDNIERWRLWDTCYSLEFSRLGGDHIRPSVASRYRQWLVHKLGTWHDQFGESGCVGCGRCITWCPVGIDLTEEIPMLVGAGRGAGRVTS